MDESLKTMLYSDDKEKLKERLAILQREYNRTVQRLKRAERSESVRNHVRSRVAEQNRRQEGGNPDSLSEHSEAKERRQCSVNHSCPEDQKPSPSVHFSLPHDVFSPGVTAGSSETSRLSDTPQVCGLSPRDESPASAEGPRRRAAHRLRSRRSRLRWERRERTDSGVSDTENSEDWRDHAGEGGRGRSSSPQVEFGVKTSQAETAPRPQPDRIGATAGGEDTELTQDQGPGNLAVSAHRVQQGCGWVACDLPVTLQPDTPVLDSKTALSSGPPEGSPPAATPSLLDAAGTPGPGSEVSVLEPETPTDGSPQSCTARPAPSPASPGAGCLDSCTLIEGLLFPVEYYVRTTRRMSAAQSSVDLGAVIQSQLSGGRVGRGRGRGRGRRGRGGSSASQGIGPASVKADCNDDDGVGRITPESESSQTTLSSLPASGAEPLQPVRDGRRRGGRRTRRGRGRSGVSPLDIGSLTLECLRTDTVLTPDTDTDCRPAEKEFYPIFQTKSQRTESSSPKPSCFPLIKENSQSSGKECLRASHSSSTREMKCETLLLPSSPAPQHPRVAALGISHLSLRFLLTHFDAKDFHLPDDEFGRLKRNKLRSAARDLETFVPHCSPYATRQRALGTPSGNSSRKRLRAARVLPPADGLRCTGPEDEPTVGGPRSSDQTDLGSGRDASEMPPPSHIPCEVTHKKAVLGCDSLPLERGNGVERVAGGCAGVRAGAGWEEEVDLPAGLSSPHVLNLGLTPTQTVSQTQKRATLALPSWGSPAFPSLGVTPAASLHLRPPAQDSQLTPQSAAPCTPPWDPVLSCEPGEDARTPSLSHVACADGHGQSQNALFAARVEAELDQGEEFTDADRYAAHSRDASPVIRNPSLSPTKEHGSSCSSLCPPNTPSPLTKPPKSQRTPPPPAPPEGEDGAGVFTVVPTDRKGEALQPTVALPVSDRWACADADADPGADMESTPTACVEEEDATPGGADPRKPAQVSLGTSDCDSARRSGRPALPDPNSLLPSSLRSEHGDLDSYFTDSAWSRGEQTPSQPGHGARGPSPAEKRRVTPPPSPPAGQEGSPSSSLRLAHTLKAPAGRCLVDVCSVYGAAGWCVVTAEEWEVCVWGSSSSQRWSLLHTWTFTEHPVISLLSVRDAHSLLCVSLGKLEIREARILCCAGAVERLSQAVLCTGEVQAVLAVSGARVACCATSVSTQTVQVFGLSEEGRVKDSLSLVSPGQSVQALATVDGQNDALIGSTDSSHLVLWNMRTGHLLQRFPLGESLSGTVCVRGYSQSGVLFVLLQHRFLHDNLDEGAPFSLIATNPVTAKSVLVHRLTRASECVGRFTDGDVWESAVVGVFQSGSLAVWDLRNSDCVASLARGPEEGCHIARWGGPSTLLVGHLNGDVFLYQYTPLGQL